MSEIFNAIVPIVPVRKTNNDVAEMVTQLLFGEQCEVLEKREQWLQIKNKYDGYIGWVDAKQIAPSQKSAVLFDAIVTSLFLQGISPTSGEGLLLNAGSHIKIYSKRKDAFFLNGVEYHITVGSYSQASHPIELTEMLKLAHAFINVPYLWGGRSSMGIDCSGFTQVLFKLMGIELPRDASQQIHEGELVSEIKNCQSGDLAFFGNHQHKITHVGIMLDASTIIHASGKVRVDQFNEDGIYNAELGTITHQLQGVKRLHVCN